MLNNQIYVNENNWVRFIMSYLDDISISCLQQGMPRLFVRMSAAVSSNLQFIIIT
jgi:hypothetical protein